MKNLRMILMSIMTMFMIIGNVNSQEPIYTKLAKDMVVEDFEVNDEFVTFEKKFDYVLISTINKYTEITFRDTLDGKNFENYDVNISFELDDRGSISEGEINMETNTLEDGVFIIVFKFGELDVTDTKSMILENIKIYGNPNGNSVGLTKNDISNDFNVYTHNNNLIVKTDDYNTQYEVSVHNMNGQMVMSEKNNGQMETYLQVPNGIYIINLITEDGGRLTKKVSIR